MKKYFEEINHVEESKREVELNLGDLEKKIEKSPFKDPTLVRKEYEHTKIETRIIKEPGAISDNGSEFSAESHLSELPPNNNLVELLVIEAIFDEGKGLAPADSPLFTMIEVAFYNHNVNYSDEKEGYRARYSLQIGFQVEIDYAFLDYLYNNTIDIVC